jgi:signal transduction histidine kinase
MFARIRNRLTLLYTTIFTCFLILFAGVSYLGSTWAVSYELNEEVRQLCLKEAEKQLESYKQNGKLEQESDKEIYDVRSVSGVVFYYLLDDKGNVWRAQEPFPEMRETILGKIRKWRSKEGQTETYSASLQNGQEIKVVMTARGIYENQHLIGTLYFGKDVTAYYNVIQHSTPVLIGISFVFLLVAAGAAHILAGRTMIPLKRSFSRQREFVADASHELRTPLTVLRTSADAIARDDKNVMSSFSQLVLADMKDEIHKMTGIVSDLLTLARADAGAIELFKERFDFAPEAERIIRMLEPSAKEKNIQLFLQIYHANAIYGDKERLSQLLTILVDNSIKYTPHGGTVIVALAVEQSDSGSLFRISVSDTGVGIEAEHQQQIFERFFRVDQNRSRDTSGSGLGLAIAHWIVKVHNGKITVSSEPGKGSTFAVSIPM